MKQIIIASRESKLALWQTNLVKGALKEKLGLDSKIITMKTEGDIILNKPLSEIGGKALFMKELEKSIQNGVANIAVHSLKDVPFELPKGFYLASFMKREDPRDAFVSNKFRSIDDLPKGAIIGTSSLRRKSQLLNYRNDLVIKELRGNVQTRLLKLDRVHYDAIILAAAGLIRLGLRNRISQFIPIEISLPAVGQGMIAIEVLNYENELINSLKVLNDLNSSIAAIAERTFSKQLKGSCHSAIAAYAIVAVCGNLILKAMVGSSDGKEILRMSLSGSDPVKVGLELAKQMINNGAYNILSK